VTVTFRYAAAHLLSRIMAVRLVHRDDADALYPWRAWQRIRRCAARERFISCRMIAHTRLPTVKCQKNVRPIHSFQSTRRP